MLVKFIINGDPKGQPRPRAFARRMGSRYVARVYDSDVADEWKAAVDSTVVIAAIENRLMQTKGAIRAAMVFSFARPKSHFTLRGVLKSAMIHDHVCKPDCDNLAKLVLDRITRHGAYWRDDSQVVHLTITKQWAHGSGASCAVELYGLERQPDDHPTVAEMPTMAA
jgi:Holliday junction resolvase RusA-like endonuclease